MMKKRADLVHYLRDHIVGGMHVGQIHAGDRLPSIREIATQLGKNERTVKAAYQVLEAEGIVEIRGRSGVFAAEQAVSGGEVAEEIARWMSSFITEAWKRRIAVPNLANEVQRFTQTRRIRCALVELITDAQVAFAHELREDWGFDVEVVAPNALKNPNDFDVFIATSFYAASIHEIIMSYNKPLVVLTTHVAMQEAIRQKVESGGLTVVAIDARFGDRVRTSYAPHAADRVRLVLTHDAAIADLDPKDPILLTRAAHAVLGNSPAPMIFPHSPTLSLETATALASIVVRYNNTGDHETT